MWAKYLNIAAMALIGLSVANARLILNPVGQVFPADAPHPYPRVESIQRDPSNDFIDVPVRGVMKFKVGVSDEVMEGMRAEKYRVPAMEYWPDGTRVNREAAPYVIVGVPNY